MKVVMCLGLLWASLLSVSAQTPIARLERFLFFGNEYVRLEEWARANNFQSKWLVPRQQLKISNSSSTLLVWADSRKVSLNGVSVWLSAPVAVRNGSAFIPPVDLTTVLQPLLFPAKTSPGKKISTICLDPGHGGKDPGNREGKQQEKKYTLLLATELGALLTKAGFKICYTRSTDEFIDLPTRPEKARRRAVDLFVSLHFNSADGAGASAVKGTEVYCLTPAHTSSTNARGEGGGSGSYGGNRFDAKNILLSYQIQKSLVKNLAVEDRGVRRARFAVLRSAEMPAVLIEGGFMTNPTEAKKIYDPVYRRRMAQAIVDGLLAYKQTLEQ